MQEKLEIVVSRTGQPTCPHSHNSTHQPLHLFNPVTHWRIPGIHPFIFRFNETIFSTLANSNPSSDFYNTTSAGEVQRLRLADSEAKNPSINNTQKEFDIRTESRFYLSVMGDPLVGVAPKEFVQIFFREERLPIAEGWHRSEIPINDTTLLERLRSANHMPRAAY
ncbi:hypothetical protein K435DRAFT_111970 [Dendrothele bispora CBS 962.96]|uniref:Heme haloperoxidase family profile domain-containing protein n=1 Tax=Dendrothele bispora (strain CBS 962.96) TaxID=1314807 RepID=A0A4S8M2H4_DENBC|nr:hypothetical protein K435DRAFT_111970 [Dendrothele bispora CBS 962.96]